MRPGKVRAGWSGPATSRRLPRVLRGSEVELILSGTFPEKYFAKKAIIEATPVLVWEGGEAAFETQGFQGEDAAGNYTVVPSKTAKSFDYSAKVAYQEGMEDGARLELRISGTMGSKSMDFAHVAVRHCTSVADNAAATPHQLLELHAEGAPRGHRARARLSYRQIARSASRRGPTDNSP